MRARSSPAAPRGTQSHTPLTARSGASTTTLCVRSFQRHRARTADSSGGGRPLHRAAHRRPHPPHRHAARSPDRHREEDRVARRPRPPGEVPPSEPRAARSATYRWLQARSAGGARLTGVVRMLGHSTPRCSVRFPGGPAGNHAGSTALPRHAARGSPAELLDCHGSERVDEPHQRFREGRRAGVPRDADLAVAIRAKRPSLGMAALDCPR
jgi:hypothetical protein